MWRRPPHPTPHARGPPRSDPGSATSSDAQRAPSRCTSSGPDFPHSATSPSRQQSPASAAAEGCPHTAYSHRRAGHGLEDLRDRGHDRPMHAGEQHRPVVSGCVPAAHHSAGRQRDLLGDTPVPNQHLPTQRRPEDRSQPKDPDTHPSSERRRQGQV